MNIDKILFVILFSIYCFLSSSIPHIYAQESERNIETVQAIPEETLEARVTKILEEKQVKLEGIEHDQLYQKLELAVTSGSLQGKTIVIENGDMPISNLQKYKLNDHVVVTYSKNYEGKDTFYIVDYVRRTTLILLFLLFAIVAVGVGKWHGFTSLLGMGISFFVIFQFILPQISSGKDPIIIAIIGSFIIVPITFYLSHGLNKKTTVAVFATLITLVVTGIIANYFVNLANLTGFASEEAGFLQAFRPGAINIKGLLLAGILIGGLGIFDDITVSQSAIVAELKKASPDSSFRELFARAMNVGRDHISSMVNTLVLVYAGAALPLLLLFVGNPRPFSEVINYEFIADEIVRTLVASIGLILAVPITTFMAALVFQKKTS